MEKKWTEPKPPTEGVSYYDHISCDTPLGLLKIEWKSWKESPSYDVELDEKWVGVEYDLSRAKRLAEEYIKEKYYELSEWIK